MSKMTKMKKIVTKMKKKMIKIENYFTYFQIFIHLFFKIIQNLYLKFKKKKTNLSYLINDYLKFK